MKRAGGNWIIYVYTNCDNLCQPMCLGHRNSPREIIDFCKRIRCVKVCLLPFSMKDQFIVRPFAEERQSSVLAVTITHDKLVSCSDFRLCNYCIFLQF